MVPLCEQIRAQHKRAVATSGARLSAWAAFLQQSIPAIPGMLHSCSLECSGMPAKTLPPITMIRASDAKRITMSSPIYGSFPTFVKERFTYFQRFCFNRPSLRRFPSFAEQRSPPIQKLTPRQTSTAQTRPNRSATIPDRSAPTA